MNARERLRTWLDSNGRRHVELVELLKVDKARLSRFLSGKGRLGTLEHYRQIEAYTGGAIKADELAAEAQPTGTRRVLARGGSKAQRLPPRLPPESFPVAAPPEPPPTQPQPEPGKPGVATAFVTELAASLGHPELAPIITIELKLALSARAESVRQRAAADILDRVAGKPTQRVLDLTPKAPAENAELLLVLRQIAGEAEPASPEPEAPRPLDA